MIDYNPLLNFRILGLTLTSEAIAMNVAFVLFAVYMIVHLRRQGISEKMFSRKDMVGLVATVLISALMGGRIWYYTEKWTGPATIITMFDIRQAGLVSVGMIFGGAAGLLLFFGLFRRELFRGHRHRVFAEFVDHMAPALALAFFIYRLFGCSIFGVCTVGTQSSLPWALHWAGQGFARHPTPFYLALSALVIFFILRVFFGEVRTAKIRFGRRFAGESMLWFMLLYSLFRLFIEFTRTQKDMYGPLNLVQWTLLVFFFCFGAELVRRYWITRDLGTFKERNRRIFGPA